MDQTPTPTPAERVTAAHDAAARWLSENASDLLGILTEARPLLSLGDAELARDLAEELREVMREWWDASDAVSAGGGQ